MTVNEAIAYIHSVFWKGSIPGLGRTQELLHRLGNPQDTLKFVHIAGTNGKGSTAAMTASILRKAGYRTGLYTSPYIYRFHERMQIDGEQISDEDLVEITEYVKPFADAMEDKPTEFELITAIGLEYFKRKKCDVVVLEAGMGGRLDSTNVISESVLSVITGISLEHTDYLGDTVEKIAAEKAGIIKSGGRIIYGGEDDSAAEVIENIAKARSAKYGRVDRSTLKILSSTLSGTSFSYKSYDKVELSLLGLYQPQNATNVIDAVEALRECGFDISNEALFSGLAAAEWPARFEIVCKDPLVIYDGAHNPQGIEIATESIKRYFGDKKVCVLTGVMKDKDYDYIAQRLASVASDAFTVTPNNPRALGAGEYARVLESKGVRATAFDNVKDAVAEAKKEAREKKTALVCLGSLYMYAEIYDFLK